jgi:hypothetical protein
MTADTLSGGKLSDAARQALERYVRELRILLQGSPTIDPAEVEAEVRSHIDQELADAPAPVSSERLDAILARLGSPTQWVPIDELPWWRRALIRLRMGPQSDRWALAVFIMWALGLLLVPAYGIGLLLIFASFLFARAVLAMSEEVGSQLMWRRWLVYPSLLSFYLPLMTWLLGFAAFLGGVPVLIAHEWQRNLTPEESHRLEHPTSILFGAAAGLGLWWIVIGIVLLLYPRLPQVLFRPFFARSPRKAGAVMLIVGAMTALAGVIGLAAWLS